MFNFPNFWLFLLTSLMVNITPGPDMLYTAARSLSQGAKAGVVSALGIFTGCLIHITAAVFGLSAVIANSAALFTALKTAGAVYLVYLGVVALLSRRTSPAPEGEWQTLETLSLRAIFAQGFMTNLLNPKVAIFFLSFLPQFVSADSPHLRAQIAALGLWFDVQGLLLLCGVALLTGYFRDALRRSPRFWAWQGKITGGILLWLGIKMALLKR